MTSEIGEPAGISIFAGGPLDLDLDVQHGPDQGLLRRLLAAVLVLLRLGCQAELARPVQQQGLDGERMGGRHPRLFGGCGGMVLGFLGDQPLGQGHPVDDDDPAHWPRSPARRATGI